MERMSNESRWPKRQKEMEESNTEASNELKEEAERLAAVGGERREEEEEEREAGKK